MAPSSCVAVLGFVPVQLWQRCGRCPSCARQGTRMVDAHMWAGIAGTGFVMGILTLLTPVRQPVVVGHRAPFRRAAGGRCPPRLPQSGLRHGAAVVGAVGRVRRDGQRGAVAGRVSEVGHARLGPWSTCWQVSLNICALWENEGAATNRERMHRVPDCPMTSPNNSTRSGRLGHPGLRGLEPRPSAPSWRSVSSGTAQRRPT